jgi:two-component system alkaline phosphatase synthesis response regulator PhoP
MHIGILDETMPQTVMIIDDEKRLVSLVESYLVQEGYHVLAAYNGKDALSIAQKEKPDLIILDIMMPEMNGYEFIRAHRAERDTPIIMLTAKVEDDDKVIGLELGADDYVTKPFKPRELMARVRNVLRRAGINETRAKTLRVSEITLDRDNREVQVAGRFVDLTPSEFDLLTALMSSPGRVFSRLDLLDVIQGVRYEGYERTIDTHIKNLRAKIEDDPRKPSHIETVYGVGYRIHRG